MTEQKQSFYGNAPLSGTGRKTWDTDLLLAQARERQQAERASRDARYDRPPTPPDAKHAEIRTSRLNLDSDLNKITLVPAGASAVGRRGRGAGYYCESCDLTFKDSLQWVDHLNSKQHLRATGQTENIGRATIQDVKSRLAWLRRKRDEQGNEYDFKKRVAERKKIEDEEARIRREKRMIKKKNKSRNVNADQANDNEDAKIMAQIMGFGGFGSTKV
ncbi:hypothetical protein V1514DRAFT_338056 [Lipomyces japonicus]|uniref:uncharacterized protein n=1 Tax=Lipomyces japonicus TaxID=56871 RepID=UPI0034CD2BCD